MKVIELPAAPLLAFLKATERLRKTKTRLPVTEGLLLALFPNGDLVMRATDLTTHVKATINLAGSLPDDPCGIAAVLDAAALKGVALAKPDDILTLTFTGDEPNTRRVAVAFGKRAVKGSWFDVDDYPQAPEAGAFVQELCVVDGDVLAAIFKQLLPFASKDALKPNLHGVALCTNNVVGIEAVGCDAHRLVRLQVLAGAITAETITHGGDRRMPVVPYSTATWLHGVLPASPVTVERHKADDKTSEGALRLVYMAGDLLWRVDFKHGLSPDFDSVIPEKFNQEFTATPELLAELKTAKGFYNDVTKAIVLDFEAGKLVAGDEDLQQEYSVELGFGIPEDDALLGLVIPKASYNAEFLASLLGAPFAPKGDTVWKIKVDGHPISVTEFPTDIAGRGGKGFMLIMGLRLA